MEASYGKFLNVKSSGHGLHQAAAGAGIVVIIALGLPQSKEAQGHSADYTAEQTEGESTTCCENCAKSVIQFDDGIHAQLAFQLTVL